MRTTEGLGDPDLSALHLPSYRREPGVHPPQASPGYRSTTLRAPSQPLIVLPHSLTEITGPVFGNDRLQPHDDDLTKQHAGEPIGQRLIVHGRVLDGDGRAIPETLVEVWQANAGGRYRHVVDNWPSPLDPNFNGYGRVLTDSEGRYRFTTIRPGIYPWGNHANAWRPAHIHFSLFGRAFTQRLVTQMYFPDDPMLVRDPILLSIPDADARQRLVSAYDHEVTQESWALGYSFDIVLRGRDATPFESDGDHDD
jgi:protocatechuate 3,4-dioxygenase, beta subunit